MSYISVLVLGIIEQKPVNPYEITKFLERIEIKKWMPVSASSIYATVKELNKKGYCEGMTEKDGNMPEKTVYSITGEGKRTLHESLREYLGSTDLDRKKFQISSLLLCHLEREEAIKILFKKLAILGEIAAFLSESAKNRRGKVPYLGLCMITHELAFVRAESDATRELLEGVKQDDRWNYFVSKDLTFLNKERK
jgi:DNA-binding PadR family transcriptional regulator